MYLDINFNYFNWVKFDIFSKDILFFPLHFENHWSLFVVIKPQLI
jgi:Ulp1 family protease